MRKEAGQIILIIILVMATALGVGLAVVQRSLTDISTSTKVEQSSRAFSAAEAGIERALRTEGNESFGVGTASVDVTSSSLLPDVPGRALEYPPISKEEMAQVWLAASNTSFDVYFGTAGITANSDSPAIEVSVVTQSGAGGPYSVKKYFFDSFSSRASQNGFTPVSGCGTKTVQTNDNAQNSSFFCQVPVSGYTGTPILARLRLLYANTSHHVAVKPTSGSLPAQARIFTSTGTAGETQRKVQVFRLDKVVPFYFDYALFSLGSIEK